MSKLLELQEKRANIWEQAKAFLNEKEAYVFGINDKYRVK